MYIKKGTKFYKAEEINKTENIKAIDKKIVDINAQEKKEISTLKAIFKGEREKLENEKQELNNLT